VTKLRPSIGWALAATVLMTAVVLRWQPAQQAVAPSESTALALNSAAGGVDAEDPHRARWRLPKTLPQLRLEPAEADPFHPSSPPVAAAAAMAPIPAALPKPPPPVAPPMRYRFVGVISDPSGQRQVYLAKEGTEVLAAAGTALDDGYAVELVEGTAVRLLHVPTQTRTTIEIPAVTRVP